MEDQVFIDGEFKYVIDEVRRNTQAIHEEYIDEGAEDEDGFDNSRCMNWRDRSKPGPSVRPDFSRFFTSDWRNARVAAKHLKFCPGDDCKNWMPLQNFGANVNMNDGLDVYCIKCNQNRREQRYRPAAKFQNRQKKTTDKFELFSSVYKSLEPKFEDEEKLKKEAVSREINKRIGDAMDYARHRYNRKISADKTEVARKLFQGGKHICNITGQILTQECFLEHHTLTFQLSKDNKKMEIVCSQCRICTPPVKWSVPKTCSKKGASS